MGLTFSDGVHLSSGLLSKSPSGLRLSFLLTTGALSPGAHWSETLPEKENQASLDLLVT